jgi:N-acetylneuraminic acid mutarotase
MKDFKIPSLVFFQSVQTYLIGAIALAGATSIAAPSEHEAVLIPDLPIGITSFGATSMGSDIFVYGGHSGEAHSYSVETTLPNLWNLSLNQSDQWSSMPKTSRNQGASLLAYEGRLFRIGGLQAANQSDENERLVSLNEVGAFDPVSKIWSDLTPLPKPRSSHDSALLDDTIYVIGGWTLNGVSADAEWFDCMYVGKIDADKITWRSEPQPFKVRANAVAAVDGKVYSVGGMGTEEGTTNDLNIYDVKSGTWSKGPSLPKGIMDGFGASACVVEGRIYVSAYMGIVYRLSENGESWNEVGNLQERRFFHRLVPAGSNRILAIGGANRQSGHLSSVELFEIP